MEKPLPISCSFSFWSFEEENLLISSEDSLSGSIPNIIKLPLGNSGKVKRLFDDHIAFCILHSNKATYFPLFPLKYCSSVSNNFWHRKSIWSLLAQIYLQYFHSSLFDKLMYYTIMGQFDNVCFQCHVTWTFYLSFFGKNMGHFSGFVSDMAQLLSDWKEVEYIQPALDLNFLKIFLTFFTLDHLNVIQSCLFCSNL